MVYAGMQREGSENDIRAAKQPEHLSVAEKIATEIISSFNPEQQNEILAVINKSVINYREQLVMEAEKQLCYLREQYDFLNKMFV